jgi:hypothetical protein
VAVQSGASGASERSIVRRRRSGRSGQGHANASLMPSRCVAKPPNVPALSCSRARRRPSRRPLEQHFQLPSTNYYLFILFGIPTASYKHK